MRVAVVQSDPEYLSVDANLDSAEQLLDKVDADLVVLPELFATGYFFHSTDDARSVAERIPDGRTTSRVVEWSSRSGAIIVAGLVEECAGKLFNTAIVVGPDGLLGRYRKLHLYYEEKIHFSPGNCGLPVFHIADREGVPFRVGVMICFDWFYPETARSLALAGADVICHPANLVRPDCPRAMPIRALENHVFTATANRVGKESRNAETLTFIGQSRICGPAGELLASLGEEEQGSAVVEIDPAESRERLITKHNDLLRDRRTDAYVL